MLRKITMQAITVISLTIQLQQLLCTIPLAQCHDLRDLCTTVMSWVANSPQKSMLKAKKFWQTWDVNWCSSHILVPLLLHDIATIIFAVETWAFRLECEMFTRHVQTNLPWKCLLYWDIQAGVFCRLIKFCKSMQGSIMYLRISYMI